MKIQYSTVRGGRRFWELGKKRAQGTAAPAYQALGVEGVDAQRKALEYYDIYKKSFGGEEGDRLGGFPPGSLGACWTLWSRSEDYLEKAVATRAEYERSWNHYICPDFGRTVVTKISVGLSEDFQRKLKKTLSPSEAWRTIKIWRALLRMLEKRQIVARAPIGAVSNPLPHGRGQFWVAAEINLLLRACKLLKWETMGLLVRVAWETAMSPIDCRTLSISMLKQDPGGWYVDRVRTKTQAETKPPISEELAADLMAYAKRLPVEPIPSSPLFRNPQGRAFSRSYMAHQFADLRRVAFGKKERRQFLDIRRSANLEAALGGASAEDRAAALGNALHKSKSLDAVYTPPTVAAARKASKARDRGREFLQQELGRKQPG